MTKIKSNKEYAGLSDPNIEAIVAGLFRFAKETQAVAILERIARKYEVDSDQDKVMANTFPTLTLWIHGFSVTEAEREKGFVGHFARLVITKIPSGKISITAEKIERALTLHPIKNRPKRQNPNTGHPLVRAAMRGKVYEKIEQLRNALLQMHEEFPETTIPGQDKLYLILYSKTSQPPVKKMRLTIVPEASGGFTLALTEHSKKKYIPTTATPELPADEEGKFASMVQLQRKRKAAPKKKKPSTK